MGIAAYNRGSRAISAQIDREATPDELVLIRDLNSEPRDPEAPIPFGPIVFVPGHGGWWATCPVTGFGYWYPTLRKAVRSLDVTVVGVGIEHGEPVFRAVPGHAA